MKIVLFAEAVYYLGNIFEINLAKEKYKFHNNLLNLVLLKSDQ